LRFPAVQDYITTKAVNFYQQKVNTEAAVDRLFVDFPSNITVEGLYLEDQQQDTLVYCKYLSVQTDLWALLDNTLRLSEIEIDGLVGNIHRGKSSDEFNFQYIADAFSSQQSTSDSSAAFDFSIGDISLKNTQATYFDKLTGVDFEGSVGELITNFSLFDINAPAINIDYVALNQTSARLRLFPAEEQPASKAQSSSDTTSAQTSPFKLSGDELKVNDVRFIFEDEASNMKIDHDLGQIAIMVDSLDINNNVYTAKQISIANSFVAIDQYSTNDSSINSATASESETIKLLAGTQKASIKNIGFRYYDHNLPTVKNGFDPGHLWIQKLTTEMKDTYFESGDVYGDISQLSVNEKGGLRIDQLEGKWSYKSQEAYLKSLKLVTARTDISGDINLTYPSIESLTKEPESIRFKADINESVIDMRDVFYFQPALEKQMALVKPNYRFSIKLNTEGQLNDFVLNDLRFDALNNTHLVANGSAKGLPDINAASFDLNVKELQTTRKDVEKVLADTLLPANLTLPQQVSSSFKVKGKASDFDLDLNLKSTMGNLDFAGAMALQEDSVYSYYGDIQISELNLGQLIQNPELGMVSLKTTVDGRGFTIEELNTTVEGVVTSIAYKNYDYKKIQIDGTIKNQQFDGKVSFDDPNLIFDFNGLVNLNDSVPEYRFDLDLQRADFQALNLSREELKARALAKARLTAESLESLNGTLDIEDVTLSKEGKIYQIDTLALMATTSDSITDIKLRSGIVDADFKGNFELETLPSVLQNHFNRYFAKDTLGSDPLKPQDFTFNVDFKDPDFVHEVLVPGLTEFVPGTIQGKYNSAEWMVDIDITINEMMYQGTKVDSLGVKVSSDKTSFNFDTKVATITTAGYSVNNLLLSGVIEDSFVKTDLKILNNKGEDRYHFGGKLNLEEDHYVFEFLPGEFLLNYEKWQVNANNQIAVLDNGVWIEDLIVQKGNQKIAIQSSVQDDQDSVIDARFNNFDLSFLGKFRETEKYILGGVLDGNFSSRLAKGIKADVGISNFSYLGDTLGNVDLKAQNINNKTELNLKVNSNRNELLVKGSVVQNKTTDLDLQAKITRLDVATVQAYAAGQVSELEGDLTGNFTVTGTVENPDIKGEIAFDNVAFLIDYLGAKFNIDNQKAVFTKTGISFDDFTVVDANKNKLTLDGTIKSDNYKDYAFDLKLNANQFQLLNTEKQGDRLVYGKLKLNSSADITGTLKNPKVRVDVSVADNSNVTYVIPESQIEVQNRKGVVEFFDADLENDDFFGQREEDPSDTLDVWIAGLDLRADIDVSSSSTLGIVIDPITQDKLTVSGDADLALNMRPSGEMTLTGRYEVEDGSYDLNFYGIAKRKFDIQSGSFLLWTGDPLNARMDVTASYSVRASPVEADDPRKVPFTVFLDLQGELLSPDIGFRLSLEDPGSASPQTQTWVSSINQQESELNKQVFSLLIFKSFMSSGTAGNGNIAQSTARNSVSRILSNQLNRLGSKIQGVELSFDLQSYQDYDESGSTGRTELELGLSKQFFDDRVVVKVAGNFDLEGKQAQQQSASDFAGDIRIEYKLTEDGRFRLVGFRENEFDNLLQGEISKTGAGVIFVRDYNAFKELFKSKEEKSQQSDDEE
ncbi:translocation/assembly module TamB, partial [Fulvivirga sp. RKSG066]|uniref:translocation/assembly module TamB domain-containing protein n=1 Tax=Fulvivirga aurantia TaxID=2529383 RepID=UPI0012BBB034